MAVRGCILVSWKVKVEREGSLGNKEGRREREGEGKQVNSKEKLQLLLSSSFLLIHSYIHRDQDSSFSDESPLRIIPGSRLLGHSSFDNNTLDMYVLFALSSSRNVLHK